MLRGVHSSTSDKRVSGFSRCSTLCLSFTKLDVNGVALPPSGKGGGERKRGEGGRDLPRGALARSASPPLPPPPPWVPGTRRKSLSLFFFFLFLFRLNSSSAAIVVQSALSTFTHLYPLSLTFPGVASPSCKLTSVLVAFLKCYSIIQGKSFWF